jgi:hypothetical protein
MLNAQQKPIGTGYTSTFAFFVFAVLFVPAILFVSHPLGYLAISLATVCAALSVGLAWVDWKRSSRVPIASVATRKAASR